MQLPRDGVLDELKSQNREWVREVDAVDPTFFKRTSQRQEPKVSLV